MKKLLKTIITLSVVGYLLWEAYRRFKLDIEYIFEDEDEVGSSEKGASDRSSVAGRSVVIPAKSANASKKNNPKTSNVSVTTSKQAVKKTSTAKRPEQKKELGGQQHVQERRENITQYIRKHREVELAALKKEFNEVSPRTLRRDMDELESAGLIKHFGTTRDVRYAYAGK